MRALGLVLAMCLVLILLGISQPQEPVTGYNSDSNQSQRTEAQENLKSHYLNLPNQEILAYLKDPQNRVSDMFQVPKEIRNMVGFWFLIYSKYSGYQTVIYDRDHPEVIYDVIDTRTLFEKGLSPVALEIESKKMINQALSEYKNALKLLAQNPSKKFPHKSHGATVLKVWNRKQKQVDWKNAESALRTQLGQRDRVMQGLSVSDRFLPAMEAIFQKFGLPPELTRITLVESSFNYRAVSTANAVGVWQFLEKSGREYLVVDDAHSIDERVSPIKSTMAAAKMFKRNMKLLGDYGLAIIAYNHGPKNLVKIRKKYKGANIAKLLTMTKETPLGYASRNYYAEFLAMLHAEKYRKELYSLPMKTYSDAISIVRIKAPASIFEVSSLYNISLHELRLFNPDIFDPKKKLPIGTRVVIPKKVEEDLVQKQAPENSERGIASMDEFIEYIH